MPKLEKFDASSYEHTDLPSVDYINFKSLDEPDYKELAYEIDFGSAYTGYLTYQGDYVINRDYDLDYYRFSVNQSSYVQISASNLPNNSYVSLLNSQNTIISQTGPNAFLFFCFCWSLLFKD